MKDIYIGEIDRNKEIRPDHYLMSVKLPLAFDNPQPGQFVMIRIAGLNDPFLSRPISIYSFKRGRSALAIELLYRVVGKGTQVMAGLIRGSQVEIHGPLGGGFALPVQKKHIVFIAGGIGVAPLSLLAETLCRDACLSRESMTFYLGAQTAESIVGLEKLNTLCYAVHVCTDDGSLGKKSLVTGLFQKDMKKYPQSETMIYACGPRGMMRALSDLLSGSAYPCQVSLEERMACGTGACMGCVAAILDKHGNHVYKRVCADGPVFDLKQVIWESV
ncbi:MAG: dihydroorotate dehydrogenase electron transfer subunit [Smithellaceae bacterium]